MEIYEELGLIQVEPDTESTPNMDVDSKIIVLIIMKE